MPREIHQIEVGGRTQYRLWSTIVDAYVTEPIDNVEELRAFLLQEAIQDAVIDFEREFPERLKRAAKQARARSSIISTRAFFRGEESRYRAGEAFEEVARTNNPR